MGEMGAGRQTGRMEWAMTNTRRAATPQEVGMAQKIKIVTVGFGCSAAEGRPRNVVEIDRNDPAALEKALYLIATHTRREVPDEHSGRTYEAANMP